jgi:hypothetical protein
MNFIFTFLLSEMKNYLTCLRVFDEKTLLRWRRASDFEGFLVTATGGEVAER